MDQLVIFNKDGVLFDTEPGKTLSYWLAMTDITLGVENHLRLREGGWDKDEYIRRHTQLLTGKGRVEVAQNILRDFPYVARVIAQKMEELTERLKGSGEEVAKELTSDAFSQPEERVFSALRLQHYNEIPLSERCQPISKMIAFVNHLARKGVVLALITESGLIRTKKELEFYADMFAPGTFAVVACKDGIVNCRSGRKVAKGGAKDEMYKKVLKVTKTKPNDCWAIEDTDKGREQARKAGITCLQVFFP